MHGKRSTDLVHRGLRQKIELTNNFAAVADRGRRRRIPSQLSGTNIVGVTRSISAITCPYIKGEVKTVFDIHAEMRRRFWHCSKHLIPTSPLVHLATLFVCARMPAVSLAGLMLNFFNL